MKIEINGKIVDANESETILDVANRNGIDIPTLCHIKDLFPSGACRMCVVEVDGFNNLPTSCSTAVYEGMKVKTHSPKVINARKTILELVLANHPDDCLYCTRNNQCELQTLSSTLGVRGRKYVNGKNVFSKQINMELDTSSPSLVRDPSKCILCGRCVRVCEEIQDVSAIDFVSRGPKARVSTAFECGINTSSCVNCGQCIVACPTGALYEKNNVIDVIKALSDPNKFVVVQHAPAISVTLGEYYGIKAGVDVAGLMNSALRKANFKKVFDTSFSADLTIMEEASELVHRIKSNLPLPMMTSCSPGWIKYVEQNYPEYLKNLSTCKSPQQMLGALIKSYFAEKEKIDPKQIVSVSIMPCTAKKFEASRSEMINHDNKISDIDYVLTTREAAELFKMLSINPAVQTPSNADNPMGERSSAGKLFGASGGVMEAAIRTAYFMLTNKEYEGEIKELRSMNGIKEKEIVINGLKLNMAVVSGLANAKHVLEDMKKGIKTYHFIEVMSCPNGCIAGGGQPFGLDFEKVRARMKGLYTIDQESTNRYSHKNKSVEKLYKDFLGEPLGEKSHELLHTTYMKRKV